MNLKMPLSALYIHGATILTSESVIEQGAILVEDGEPVEFDQPLVTIV